MSDDDALRAAFAAATRTPPATRAGCPAPEALQELADGSGDAPERLVLLQHVATCAACRADFDLLRTASQAAAATTVETQAPRATRTRPRWVPMLAAAAVLAVVASTVLREVLPGDDVVRGDAATGVGDVRLIALEERGDSVRLIWGAVPQAVRYTAEVTLDDGSPVFTAETADTIAVGARQAGRIARWRVMATLLDGTIRTASRTVTR